MPRAKVAGFIVAACVLATPMARTYADPVPPRECTADFDQDGVITSNDFIQFLNQYFIDHPTGGLIADFDGNGFVNAMDVAMFVNAYLIQGLWSECA